MAKSGKQVYKALTKAQGKKAASLAKKGQSQKSIAKSLGVGKQRVATFLKGKALGKRAKGTFWDDVKHEETLGYSWKEARERIYKSPKWGKKRAAKVGKEFQTWQDFWDEQKEAYKGLSEKEQKEKLAEDMEERYLVSV